MDKVSDGLLQRLRYIADTDDARFSGIDQTLNEAADELAAQKEQFRVLEDEMLVLGDERNAAQAKIAELLNFVDKNMIFYDVDADSLIYAPNIPVLASVSNRIWYHATDDTKSCPFSAVIDAAMKEMK